MPPYRSPSAAGDVINHRYKLLFPLGVGALGDIWAAQKIASNLKVALKILKPELIHSQEFKARLNREHAVLTYYRRSSDWFPVWSVLQCGACARFESFEEDLVDR